MTQGEAIAAALSMLSIGINAWVLWQQHLMRREMDAAWADIDGLNEAARAVR